MGFFGQATNAKEETLIGQEKEQVEIAYVSAAINKLGDDVTDEDLQNELDKSVGVTKTLVTPNSDGTLNVLFNDTEHNYNVNNGVVSKVEPLSAGLYDANKNLLANWNELVNNYGLDVQIDYTITTYKTKTTSPYYILTNKSELSTGTILVIDESVKKIGNHAFHGCTSLASITIPNTITGIGAYAFYGCTSLASITIPDTVTGIGDSTFRGCTSLASITIPDTVTDIGDSTFQGCTSLASIRIPDAVTGIGASAFYGCTDLSTIYIPSNVIKIYDAYSSNNAPFNKCSSSLIVYCAASEVQEGWGNYWNWYGYANHQGQILSVKYGYTREQYEAEINS